MHRLRFRHALLACLLRPRCSKVETACQPSNYDLLVDNDSLRSHSSIGTSFSPNRRTTASRYCLRLFNMSQSIPWQCRRSRIQPCSPNIEGIGPVFRIQRALRRSARQNQYEVSPWTDSVRARGSVDNPSRHAPRH